jgi:hypothetical protein
LLFHLWADLLEIDVLALMPAGETQLNGVKD